MDVFNVWVERYMHDEIADTHSTAMYTLPYDNVTEGFILKKKKKRNL